MPPMLTREISRVVPSEHDESCVHIEAMEKQVEPSQDQISELDTAFDSMLKLAPEISYDAAPTPDADDRLLHEIKSTEDNADAADALIESCESLKGNVEDALTKRYASLYGKISSRVYRQYCASSADAQQVSASDWGSVFMAAMMTALDNTYAAKLRSPAANPVAIKTLNAIREVCAYPRRLCALLKGQWAPFDLAMETLQKVEDYEFGVASDPDFIRVHPIFNRHESKTFVQLAQDGRIVEAETALSLMPSEPHVRSTHSLFQDWPGYHQRALELVDPNYTVKPGKLDRPKPFEIRLAHQPLVAAYFALVNAEHRIYQETEKVLDSLRRINPTENRKALKFTATQIMVDSAVFPTQAMGRIIEDVERARFVVIAAICKPAIDQQYRAIAAKDGDVGGACEAERLRCVQAGMEMACKRT